ncbi:MAG: SOS response-associated peptidase [Balneolaceae bacterium]|nr:SOS response-associated peptidase [Balneolaceae bacterium]
MKRYVLETDKYIIEEHYGIKTTSEAYLEPNYNVMAGHTMPIIIQTDNGKGLISSTWGLKLEGSDQQITSVQQDDVQEDETFMKLIRTSPCIVPASGFYKWKETVEDPLPFYIRFLTDEVFSIPGFYSSWKDEKGQTYHSFALLTMDANPLIQPLDDSMPCILEPSAYDQWLNGHGNELLENGFKGEPLMVNMAVVRVPELVNDPSNNGKELIQPIPKLRNYDLEEE